jgi:type I restriction-modification system DNA methylase subunit
LKQVRKPIEEALLRQPPSQMHLSIRNGPTVLTTDIRNQIDRIWDAFWSGGISNPLEVIEQITYLLFIKRLDDLHTLEENKSTRLKKPMERRVFPGGKDSKGRSYEDFRWSRFKHFEAKEMYAVVNDHVFPFLRTLGRDNSTYAHHMKDARFTIPTPALLAKVVDMIEQVPMEDRDTKGDLYEYMLGKIATAGAERPVPHPAPHHPAHGGTHRSATARCHLRSRLWHGGVSGGRWRISP